MTNQVDLTIAKEIYESIAKEIHSDQSPVGIDAKKTHIIILQKLIAIEERLKKIEEQLGNN